MESPSPSAGGMEVFERFDVRRCAAERGADSVARCPYLCFGSGLTREHVWPEWLKQYIPRTHKTTFHQVKVVYSREPGKPVENERYSKGHLTRQGDPASQRLRVVCKKCNTGWMSRLQQKAKPIMLPLINDEWRELDVDSQRILAAWITMFTMVIEFAHPMTAGVTAEHRRLFLNNQQPLPTWLIYFGTFQGKDWSGDFNHWGWRSIS